jgi:hypothetical protein
MWRGAFEIPKEILKFVFGTNKLESDNYEN